MYVQIRNAHQTIIAGQSLQIFWPQLSQALVLARLCNLVYTFLTYALNCKHHYLIISHMYVTTSGWVLKIQFLVLVSITINDEIF